MKRASAVGVKGAVRGLIGCLLLVAVATPWLTLAAAISHGYQGSSELAVGSLVAQSKNNKFQVVAADSQHSDALLGVVVAKRTSTLEISDPSDVVQVATSGKTTAIVSDLGGRVRAGDLIAASPIQGVGMKAVVAGKSIGVAAADAPLVGVKQVAVTASNGKQRTVQISTVPVVLEVAYFVPPDKKSPYPLFVQSIADAIAGKPVSIVRVLIASGILLTALVIVAVMLFSGIRNTLISIGRNPLARGSIFQLLWRILATVAVILLAAFGSAYLIISG